MKTYYVVRLNVDDSDISYGINTAQYICGIYETQYPAERFIERMSDKEAKLEYLTNRFGYVTQEYLDDYTFGIVTVPADDCIKFGGAFYIE